MHKLTPESLALQSRMQQAQDGKVDSLRRNASRGVNYLEAESDEEVVAISESIAPRGILQLM